MGTNRYDVVVVGAGLSGLVAAGVAAHRNLNVALVATGAGSFVTGPAWLKAQEIQQASAAPDLGEAIAYFCELASLAGCPYAGDISVARFLPTILGDFYSIALAPLTLWNAEPRKGISTAIVGVRGLSNFDENFMAERLTEQARLITSGCTYTARQISLLRDMGVPVTTLRIAQCFDRDPAFREELLNALRAAASGFKRILVPGILGLETSAEQIAEVERDSVANWARSPLCLHPFPPCVSIIDWRVTFTGSAWSFIADFPLTRWRYKTVYAPGYRLTARAAR